jgi:tungstate transport system substrate-binding protein
MGLLLYQGKSAQSLILVTTTSTQDSGLLDALIPAFEDKRGYRVKTIAIGTGQSLALGARGEADVALVHAPDLEKKYLAQGAFLNRRLVMFNHFAIVGPAEDPAQIRSSREAVTGFRRIAESGAPFVSRGDNSGTHILENRLWREAGVEPEGDWYIEAGQGMGATLMIASEKHAYTLADQGTQLAFKERTGLETLIEGGPLLLNLYHVMAVNHERFPRVNQAGASALAEFLVSDEAQEIIRTFGVERYSRPLFFPFAAAEKQGGPAPTSEQEE